MKFIPNPKPVSIPVRFVRVFALNFAIILTILAVCGFPNLQYTLPY